MAKLNKALLAISIIQLLLSKYFYIIQYNTILYFVIERLSYWLRCTFFTLCNKKKLNLNTKS